ncbi:ABC transporter permease [Alkalibacter rhizosphaerae]|uniref:ABC transporter permease n=1 Tax=Alkalibacter rhizosphaerae TaxID=2815577 RepID=A0A975AHW0_9FIRM|nr:ABC transporter permease [Alkalibacter rhizosphaerae]QSX08034.1 ABC transporter permease [Alkalibacter rhizosphaerae]
MIFESIRMSFENIVSNKLRSFLTMLGIVIGVAAIIALITIVQGATSSITDQVTSLGVNKVTVNVMGTAVKQGLDDVDVEEIAALSNISGVSPTVSRKMSVTSERTVMDDISVQGNNDVYFKNDDSLLKSGRAINILDLESDNQVAVIGSDIANELFYGTDPVGQELLIGGRTYSIIGTLASSSAFGISSVNSSVIIPYTTALRSMGIQNITSLDAFLVDTTTADETVQEIERVLDASFNYKENAFSVFNMGDMISSFESITGMMTLLLAGIAAISLVVGGIGIMNMMLVSVTERRMEIGLRKALGATPRTIQAQFIIESIFLSLIGGTAGLVLGAAIAYIAAGFIGTGFAIAPTTIYIALGFSAAVGILFGYMPARKASRLNPIDALRSL